MPYVVDPRDGQSQRLNRRKTRRALRRGAVVPLDALVTVPPVAAHQIFVRTVSHVAALAPAWWADHKYLYHA